METNFSEESYNELVQRLFSRFKSFQTAGREAYHPGLEAMELFDSLLGHPHRGYRTVHVAGTNGKGSVSNMLAAALAATGKRVGLYTSPHLLDVRERIRILDFSSDQTFRLIPKADLYDFCRKWEESFSHLHLSFFEITTAMAFNWFAEQNVDVAVIETGLGGRLDSTNIITPSLSVITNIGLDHCDLLGETLPEIAYEKAGIIKPGVPVVIGEAGIPAVNDVFRQKVIYCNSSSLSSPSERDRALSLLHFAQDDSAQGVFRGPGCVSQAEILEAMDLKGPCQRANLLTVLAALEILCGEGLFDARDESGAAELFNVGIVPAIEHTVALTGFHGRWEKLCSYPDVIADIGHNAHGLSLNFQRLRRLVSSDGPYSHLVIVYGTMADKDWQAVAAMFPEDAHLIFTQAKSPRALSADVLGEYGKVHSLRFECVPEVEQALREALSIAEKQGNTLVYVGGSAYVVAEAAAALQK